MTGRGGRVHRPIIDGRIVTVLEASRELGSLAV